MIDIYNDGEYLDHNPTWHVEDSSWKAGNILKIMKRNQLAPKTIAEIGCGAGEILNQLHQQLRDTELLGFEISELAYQLSTARAKERLQFKKEDLLANSDGAFFDALLVIDVFEHVEDYYAFLRQCREKGRYKIFHIPLDISVQSVLRTTPFKINRKLVGHIHFFTKETALASLEDTGYKIIDYFYTATATDLPSKTLKSKLARWPRKFLFRMNKDLTVRILGGYSLMVLAE